MKRAALLLLIPLPLLGCGGDGGGSSSSPINFAAPVVGHKTFFWPCDAFVAFEFYSTESNNDDAGWYVDEAGQPQFWSGAGGGLHRGVDLVALTNDYSVHAAAAGTAYAYPLSDGHPYGNRVVVDHGDSYYTIYGHLSLITAQSGQPVSAGQSIGTMGMTGNSGGGVHLHFEVRHEPNGAVSNWQRYCPGIKFEWVSKVAAIQGYFPVHAQ